MAVLTLSAAACSGDDSPSGETAAATLPSTSSSTTSTTVGVDEVPEEITVEYVQRVMDTLDASWGDMHRELLASRSLTPAINEWLDALYDEPELARIRAGLENEASEGFDDTRAEPGDPESAVRELITVRESCVFVALDRTYDAVLTGSATEDPRAAIALRAGTPGEKNPTAWQISYEGPARDGLPEDPCV